MVTILATRPVESEQLSILDLVTDVETPLGQLHAKDFREACERDAAEHDGWIHPSRVSLLLHNAFDEINPRALSAQWAGACGRNGFMDKTDVWAPIDARLSKGNGGKSVRLRRLRT